MNKKIQLSQIEKSCQEICTILKALSHPRRLLIMGHLLGGEKSVGELVELCETSQSQISQFLIRMKAEGLVDCRREGRLQIYFVSDPRLRKLMETIQNQYCP